MAHSNEIDALQLRLQIAVSALQQLSVSARGAWLDHRRHMTGSQADRLHETIDNARAACAIAFGQRADVPEGLTADWPDSALKREASDILGRSGAA